VISVAEMAVAGPFGESEEDNRSTRRDTDGHEISDLLVATGQVAGYRYGEGAAAE
jgi:hypothetical protein